MMKQTKKKCVAKVYAPPAMATPLGAAIVAMCVALPAGGAIWLIAALAG